MSTERVPMRWPAEWTDPARLELLEGTPINCLVGDEPPPFPLGDIEFLTLDGENPPDGVTLREIDIGPGELPPVPLHNHCLLRLGSAEVAD